MIEGSGRSTPVLKGAAIVFGIFMFFCLLIASTSAVSADDEDIPKSRQAYVSQLNDYVKLSLTKKERRDAELQRERADNKIIYLTYDDGPSGNTGHLLDVLDKYGAKATFFIVGNAAQNNRDAVRRECDEGNTVGIHSYSHNYKQIYASQQAFMDDFNRTRDLITDITGSAPRFYRMPGGSNNAFVDHNVAQSIINDLKSKGYTCMDWTAASNDATGHPYDAGQLTNYAIDTINQAVSSGRVPVLLMHDTDAKPYTAEVTETVIKTFAAQGYSFRALDDYDGDGVIFAQ